MAEAGRIPAGEVCWVLSLGPWGRAHSLCSRGSSASAEPLGQNPGLAPTPPHRHGFVSPPLSLLQLFWDLFSLSCSAGRAGSQEKASVVCWVVLWGLFTFHIRLLWFCSCFSLECLCALCFAFLAGFAAQAMGAPCRLGTPAEVFGTFCI